MNIENRIKCFLEKNTLDQVMSSPDLISDLRVILIKIGVEPGKMCPGCVRSKYETLKKRYYFKTKINNFMKKNRRYWLREGQRIRPTGSPVYYSNDNLTDEIVEEFEKMMPGFKKSLIDTESDDYREEKKASDSKKNERATQLNSKKKEELLSMLEDLTGESIDEKSVTKDKLIEEIIKEEKAIAEITGG